MDILLNEYENLRELSQSSFARIYKVRHLDFGYIRAIRVLNARVENEDDMAYQTFLKECKILLQFGSGGHPNIIRIYQPRLLYNNALVEMDYIDGCDLDTYLLEQNYFVPTSEILRFAKEIGSALAYCHVDCFEFLYDKNKEYEYVVDKSMKGQKFTIAPHPDDPKIDFITDLQRLELIHKYGITHDGLHSKNIMRKKYDGSFILLDFGMSVRDGLVMKSSSRIDNAVEYKAPERWQDKSNISEKSDIYSFGVLMYKMLAGRAPFTYNRDKYNNELATLNELRYNHMTVAPPAIEPLRRKIFETANKGKTYEKDYPDRLEKMIMKCLEKKPQKRYANAKAFVEDFERYLSEKVEDVLYLQNKYSDLHRRFDKLTVEKSKQSKYISSLTCHYSDAISACEHNISMLKSDNEKLYKNNRKRGSVIAMGIFCIVSMVIVLILYCLDFHLIYE